MIIRPANGLIKKEDGIGNLRISLSSIFHNPKPHNTMHTIKDKITPGPWDLYKDSPADSVYCDDALGNRVANCENLMLPREQRIANANAISKVPEMLDIIERLAKAGSTHGRRKEDLVEGCVHDAQMLMHKLNTQTEKV